ncbi:CelD/BcsL family acetyltransferase involved in cellulose biosynthesis [Rhodoligotrophos appendicifer]|uniref:GNAT family N-acetyltransferase n=1 Tax=Rhodoligotrophos appendicifer TaxID=987056 RepID=UPI0011856AC3|nr:GNAT family N-acetyltransferase [Rhodoligotrophos appendicifer]
MVRFGSASASTSASATAAAGTIAESPVALSAWNALVRSAAEPSLAADPAWVLPALRHLDPRRDAIIATEMVNGAPGFVAVLRKTRWRWGIPCPVLTSWSHAHHFLGTPLVNEKDGFAGFTKLFSRGLPVLWTRLPLEGAAMAQIEAAAQGSGAQVSVTNRHERACYRPDGRFEERFKATVSRHRRKEFRRLRARLAEQGDLRFTALCQGDRLDPWFDQFEALEASGWKGRRGSALAQDEPSALFLREAGYRLAAEGRLMFWALTLDDRPVAMLWAMISGRRAWLGKIAYDETLARSSPGVLLMLEATAALDRQTAVDLVDSCATPDHGMINHLWRDRLAIGDVLVTPPGFSKFLHRLLVLAEQSRTLAACRLRRLKHSLIRKN